ncbi:4'-phosphopantetheinyl transferase superfamily protein [Vibrio europaeus]|uniref:Enterobactin synthase component D n=1 Tax=Vibrio europaeus TaxID=300876 RepID=A0A178J9U3_9VIBR|nr:4'-phosphopantetheinyl transferase superfamily protein [Vibrio europaeus]MDC5705054.1 4'-phosphopantetheinyl transferase superfamily protein [Vibrio europaeus]MDC5710333.1 4'-phosphopantetheinyl transferase superfamily protein [Vibrio europaeus]MDC5715423.1 4'-phosphopantetheinyl transferase superfamily protein [Vibrio europaeus]MDC5724528.1 4'-phosphopantetheinyl transferase superfamily protein [Vibrio europaeus]MDC5728775.1 4'-phosphopantetheinyl transferase superfamily protein [Vibrio eu
MDKRLASVTLSKPWLTRCPNYSLPLPERIINICVVKYDISHFSLDLQLSQWLPLQLRQANHKRQAEFVAGRVAAHYSMSAFNQNQSVEINPDRSPLFPKALKGSISHSQNLAIAATTPSKKMPDTHLGIDIQHWFSSEETDDVAALVCKDVEIERLQGTYLSYQQKVTLLFSAKEALYKAIYPHVKEVLDFDVVELVDAKKHALYFDCSGYLIDLGLPPQLKCHYQVHNTHIVTLALCGASNT